MKIYKDKNGFIFYCPGCKNNHLIDSRWAFNGDYEKPTFDPSLLCKSIEGIERINTVCHSFIREGNIEYLSDCTHDLKGKKIKMEEINFENL